jgi:hypothetical protein
MNTGKARKTIAFHQRRSASVRGDRSLLWLFVLLACVAGGFLHSSVSAAQSNQPVKLVEPLNFHDELVEVTEAGTLRRRYRVRDDYEAEVRQWKQVATTNAAARKTPPRTFRLGCIFLKDAQITCPDVMGSDGKPLCATFTTPTYFVREMTDHTAAQYVDFSFAFTGGAVRSEWVFQTLQGLKWTAAGKSPNWGCQARAIADQAEAALAQYKDSKIDMWVWCAGKPQMTNARPGQHIAAPPYGISYTQWQLLGGYNLAISAPHLPLVVHEINHRYLDNLLAIEGVQLTQFHGLAKMGYDNGDLGYPDLLATYRSVYLQIIRPAMWQRFSLTGPATAKPESFSGKMYHWADVKDDCWFRLPLLTQTEMAQLTGLTGLQYIADRNARWRQFVVPDESRKLLRSPYSATADATDTKLNNVLSLGTESCAVLATATGHWLIVRPEVADVFVEMLSLRGKGPDLEVAGWLNEGINPLVVVRAPADLAVPEREIGYFRQ